MICLFLEQIGNDKIWKSNEIKLLGVAIDNKLKFDSHIKNIYFKAKPNLGVLRKLVSLLTFDKKRILFKAFFEFQFRYCPLTWMFCNRRANNKINKLHEQALRLI